MDFSVSAEVSLKINTELKIDTQFIENVRQPFIFLPESSRLLTVCKFLYSSPLFYFDFLNCVTAIDNGTEAGSIDLIYHLSSIPFEKSVVLKVQIDRELDEKSKIDSVSSIWKTADWHEREIFDFYGVKFNNHPDLRRILLPADWEGHPMRKDYQEQETYHGIKVKY
ncbi:NADH-quinone oxidoreductase subunit C [Lacihabitans soyangensis]|uniref:NADH-quinone oxidoreductase subunit C n=1 Tax=Lacihabitans soyangensis TaxID=869394 RepID=A0AAE3KXV3_9BACT|nr:NADH-quinone oxidoreductase subunit C [Lacihabitans soyangensis]MCP9765865.1 NADH-quinone oxidoreductase subunit C [Lacihabitans soyangensis]